MVNFPIPPMDEAEVLRLSCFRNPGERELTLLREKEAEILLLLDPSVEEKALPKAALKDSRLKSLLGETDALLVFHATLGPAAERYFAGLDPEDEEAFIPASGILAERLGALIEAFCDYKAEQFAAGGAFLTPHYPYGEENGSPVSSTRILGIGMDHASHTPERCRSCYVTGCPSRR